MDKTYITRKCLTNLALILILGLFSACETIGPLLQSSQETAPAPQKPEETIASPSPEPDTPPITGDATLGPSAPLEDETLGENRRSEFQFPGPQLNRPDLVPTEKAVRLAILLPLTGPHQKIGNDLLNAANMALFDHNNTQLRLQPYDTKGTVEGAKEAALAAAREGSEIFMGPLFSASVKAVQPIAQQNNINILAFSTDITAAQEGVYLMGLTVQQQIDRVLEFSYRQGLVNFAVLAPENAYGDTAVSSIQNTIQRLGLNLTQLSRYPANLPPGSEELQDIAKTVANYEARQWSLRQALNKLKGKTDPESKAAYAQLSKLDTLGDVNFDALIIPEGGQKLRELAPLLSYYDVDPAKVKFIGTGLWADISLTTEPSLVGGWFAAPSPEATNQFLARYNSIYGYTPPRIASLAYDALALSGLLAQDEGDDKFSTAKLQSTEGFSGYNGIFRFQNSGIAERGLAVMQLGQDNLELLEPAPGTFTPAIN